MNYVYYDRSEYYPIDLLFFLTLSKFSFKLIIKFWWWKLFHSPIYKSGQKVRLRGEFNNYFDRTLWRYQGPCIICDEYNNIYQINEEWTTFEGPEPNHVYVLPIGHYWRLCE